VNKTFEPGIEIPFTQAFLREFILDKRIKVVDRSEADSILEGVIKSFNISSVSYDRSGLVMEYQTTVVMDLTLKKQSGEPLWMEEDLSETYWYRSSSNILAAEANKAVAIQQMGRFVAGRIRHRFLYQF
jgi:outer membrane lipopolysaccharide assembly protein LptE/RlpB